jgi:hypothetical protein
LEIVRTYHDQNTLEGLLDTACDQPGGAGGVERRLVDMDALIVVGAVSFVSGASLAGIYFHLLEMRRRIGKLEQDQAKHLPYRTADEIEDATAAILNMKFKLDFNQELIENALAHLRAARSGNGK